MRGFVLLGKIAQIKEALKALASLEVELPTLVALLDGQFINLNENSTPRPGCNSEG